MMVHFIVVVGVKNSCPGTINLSCCRTLFPSRIRGETHQRTYVNGTVSQAIPCMSTRSGGRI
jgi:hypothetical protein